MVLFILEHYNYTEDGSPNMKRIGVYSSRQRALEAFERVKGQRGFRDYPALVDWELNENADEETDGFHLSVCPLDTDGWVEGFVKV